MIQFAFICAFVLISAGLALVLKAQMRASILRSPGEYQEIVNMLTDGIVVTHLKEDKHIEGLWQVDSEQKYPIQFFLDRLK